MFNTNLVSLQLRSSNPFEKQRLSSISSHDSGCFNSPVDSPNYTQHGFYEFNLRSNEFGPRSNELNLRSNEFNARFNEFSKFELTNEQTNECAFEKLMKLAETIFETRIKRIGLINYSNLSMVNDKFCKFCKNNMEPRSLYMSHMTRNQKGEITCPILMNHKCEICSATGIFAHTRSYCPFSRIVRRSIRDVKSTYIFHNMNKLNSALNRD